jgi:hypothetical protein
VAGDDIRARVLAIVAEKTGYPTDMLDLELDLEADLGIDTVKQAEMFAAIRQVWDIPRDENLKLRDFPTLKHVIGFVNDRRPDKAVAAPAVADAPPAPAQDPVVVRVLEIVAEKTGYPTEMLDLDLDLESDLGIDTVKQAETFAAVRAAFNIPRDENLKLRDFPTLAHVIRFAREGRTDGADVQPAVEPGAAPPTAGNMDAANSIPRRIPVPAIRPALAVCKRTAVNPGPGSRVVLMRDSGGVAEALTQRLQAMGVEVLAIEGAPEADALIETLKGWIVQGPVHGLYWLPALDIEEPLAGMDVAGWHEALRVRVKLLYAAMRTLYEQIAAPGTFLISATRLGGQHGYDEAGASAPLGGAVTGFTKTYKHERPDALVKAVDFEVERDAQEIANLLVEETLNDPGAVELGYKGGDRWTVTLLERPAEPGERALVLDKDTVFVVTGAAGSIVSAITADLAAASGGTFYLLDLTPEPDSNNPDLKRFVSDREGLKRELAARIQARGERATPAMVEKELASLERSVAAKAAIDAVRAAGGTATWFSVNLTDG